MSTAPSSNNDSLSPVSALRAQINALREEIAILKKSAKASLHALQASQQDTLATARHDGYVNGITDAMAIYQKRHDALLQEIKAAEKNSKHALPAARATPKQTSTKNVTKQSVTAKRKPTQRKTTKAIQTDVPAVQVQKDVVPEIAAA